MEDKHSNGWPTWAAVLSILVALLIGMLLGWFAHGFMMHQMMNGGMMDNRGMMGSMMSGSDESGMNRSAMMARCRSMMGEGGCPMMQAPSDTTRQSPGEMESPIVNDLDETTRDWVRSIRGDLDPKDARGTENVTVEVGTGEQGLSFGPAVLLVDPGTTVTFRWTGQGGVHNVNFLGMDRKSSLGYESGTTYRTTLNEQGVYRYVCSPHRTLGMKGIVIVR